MSSDQPTGLNDNKFNWELIKLDQLGQKPYCDQYLSHVTDAEGRFEFSNILPGKYLQLAFWGNGVPKGRSLAFDETRPGKTETVTITLPQPASLRGTVDRTTLTDVGFIQLSKDREAFHDYNIELRDEQTTFEFNDLPPGTYSLAVMGKPVRFTENGQVFSRISPIAHVVVELGAGENKEADLTEPDRNP